MKLHILTLNWNGENKLNNLHTGLKENLDNIKNKLNIDSFWHIRDNGSKDNSVRIANSFNNKNLNTKVYEINHNRDNFSIGINYLFSKINPDDDDIILLLNNDIWFMNMFIYKDNRQNFLDSRFSILNMIELLNQNLNIGVVGARLLYSATDKLQHAGVIFSEKYAKMPYHFKHKEISDIDAEKNRYFQAVTAACCLFKASDFKLVNGFNEKLIWCFDDIDFCLKIGRTKKIAYCGKTYIWHEESGTLKINPVNKMFLQHNVKTFKDTWFGKYEIDHEKYLKDPNYNLIK